MVDFGQDRNHPHLGRGFAYIEFSNADEAETAMKHMDGGQIDGQVIQIFLNCREDAQIKLYPSFISKKNYIAPTYIGNNCSSSP